MGIYAIYAIYAIAPLTPVQSAASGKDSSWGKVKLMILASFSRSPKIVFTQMFKKFTK